MNFGSGLVKTSEDFGSQGEWPTHPELLDWLAAEFSQGDSSTPHSSLLTRTCEEVRSGGVGEESRADAWDIKHIVRLIVTSGTYCQSSRVTPESLRRDPENSLLARGPRFRMDAEMVRDTARAVSGLLLANL